MSQTRRANTESKPIGREDAPKVSGTKTKSKSRHRCTRLRRSRRPRARLCDAMRIKGMDEYRVAGLYVCLTEALRTGDKEHCANPKLMLDTLKECTRMLELSREVARPAAGSAPAPVQLMHYMLRPDRNKAGNAPPEPVSAVRNDLQEAAALA